MDDPRIANSRDVQEFVTCVGALSGQEVPVADFGGQYFVVAIDVTPTKYRILMSLPKPLTPEQTENAMKKKLFPADMITAGAPNLEGFRYLPSDWVDYSTDR